MSIQYVVNIDPIDAANPQPPSLTIMVAPGQKGVTPESAKAGIEALLAGMGLEGIPFKLIGQIERHTTDAAGKHVHLTIADHAHS